MGSVSRFMGGEMSGEEKAILYAGGFEASSSIRAGWAAFDCLDSANSRTGAVFGAITCQEARGC